MGKKKDKKKGKGAEKTALKTEKKAEKKSKKLLKEKGEEDIEVLIAESQEKDRKTTQTTEEKCEAPSPRCNMSLTPHPDKEDLLMFGGEYFNGKQTVVYNDLYFFNIKNHTWSILKTSTAPPPRCGHQAVALRQGGGQLWVFGGEFASPTQSQFYHYKDLWFYQFAEKKWETISAPNGPSSRSGHRMAACKKLLIVFGGFHDNIRDYKYFNDLYAFNTETFTWTELKPSGPIPLPRSACVMTATQDQNHVIIYGGYSKERIKKDVDKGKIHVDMFKLSPEGKTKEVIPDKWKWISVKQNGVRPSPRCGCSLVATPGNRAIVFGGVFDEEEDDEELKGVFYNDMYNLELDNGKWHEVFLKGKKEIKEKKRRRHKKQKLDTDMDNESEGSDLEMEETIEHLKVTEDDTNMVQDKETTEENNSVCPAQNTKTVDDGIFTVTVGNKQNVNRGHMDGIDLQQAVTSDSLFWPSKRMNSVLAVKNGILYLYGGMTEDGDKQLTFSDFYSLDLHKLDEWNTIIVNDVNNLIWEDSSDDSTDDSSDDDEEGACGGKRKYSDSDSDDDESDDDLDLENPPDIKEGESSNDFFSRTRDFWMNAADDIAEKERLDVTTKQLKKAAFKMAEEYLSKKK